MVRIWQEQEAISIRPTITPWPTKGRKRQYNIGSPNIPKCEGLYSKCLHCFLPRETYFYTLLAHPLSPYTTPSRRADRIFQVLNHSTVVLHTS